MRPIPKRTIIIGSEARRRCGGYSNTHCLRLERVGRFPQRIHLGPTRVGYYEDEIDEWIATRIRAGGQRVPGRSRRPATGEATTST
jgi:predicted DNA-binding transcriptional regulator AlpA